MASYSFDVIGSDDRRFTLGGVSAKATVDDLARKIEETHDLLYPEEAGRSKKVLRLRHKEVFDLPPQALVSDVLANSSAVYAVWNAQAFSHVKSQGKTPSQLSVAAATVQFAGGAWTKVDPPKSSKRGRKAASDSKPSPSDETPSVAAPAAAEASGPKPKAKSKSAAAAAAPGDSQAAASSASKRDRSPPPPSPAAQGKKDASFATPAAPSSAASGSSKKSKSDATPQATPAAAASESKKDKKDKKSKKEKDKSN